VGGMAGGQYGARVFRPSRSNSWDRNETNRSRLRSLRRSV
jgi:hypothetical protein